MKRRVISVVALSNRDYASLEEKLAEAVRWMAYAADQGAELVVLPEMLNCYRGDGPENPAAVSLSKIALDDWETAIQPLREAAMRLSVAVVVPVLIREEGCLHNVFFLLSRQGRTMGRGAKLFPTPEERAAGVVPGEPGLLDWEGLPISGAICFDTNFLETFEWLSALGSRLLVIPSLWNGGPWLAGLAARFALPMAVSSPAWSRIIDLDGAELAAGGYRQETLRFGFGAPVFTASLNFDREVFHLNNQAGLLRELQQKYRGKLQVRLLHEQAAFLLESVSEELAIPEVAAEYGLVTFCDYLAASQKTREAGS